LAIHPPPLDAQVKNAWGFNSTTGWTIGVLGFDSRRGLRISLFTTASRTALGPTQPPIQWVPGALSLGVKRPRREADHSPPSSAEVKECVELYLHSPDTPSWGCAQLITGTTLTFAFYLYLLPTQWVPGFLSLGVDGRGVKLTTHLLLVSRSKNKWSYTFIPPIRLHGLVLS
jgi:hypothetical protein